MQTTSPVRLEQYINKDGEIFDLSWCNWEEPIEANYRMYFIKSSHVGWGNKTYTVFITKKSYPNKKDATHLVTSYVLNKIKQRLDMAKDGEHFMFFTPLNYEGWALI